MMNIGGWNCSKFRTIFKNGFMFLYLEWLQNVLQCYHRNDWCFSCFHFHLPPHPILKLVVLVALLLFPCFVPFTPDGSEFAFTHFPITIESFSLNQSAILTKRINSWLLAVHVKLTQQHAFCFYLHLPQIEEVLMHISVKECINWRLNEKVSIDKWAPTLLLVTNKNCLSTIILKEATHMCQFF